MGEIGTDDQYFAIMDRYVELGGDFFDTARVYQAGRCDITLGKWIKSRGNRSQIKICAKGSHPNPDTMHISRLTRGEILGDLEASLTALQTDYADVYILHRDDPKLPVAGIVDALDEAVRQGKTRRVGLSNWTCGRIAEAIDYAEKNGKTKPVLSQLLVSLACTSPHQTRDVTHVPINAYEAAWYRETQFPVMGFGSQGRGFFARLATGQAQKPDMAQYYGWYPENLRRANRAITLAKELDKPLAAVLTAYTQGMGLRAVALVAVSSPAQLDEVWQAHDLTLTKEQIRYLESGE